MSSAVTVSSKRWRRWVNHAAMSARGAMMAGAMTPGPAWAMRVPTIQARVRATSGWKRRVGLGLGCGASTSVPRVNGIS